MMQSWLAALEAANQGLPYLYVPIDMLSTRDTYHPGCKDGNGHDYVMYLFAVHILSHHLFITIFDNLVLFRPSN